MEEKRRQVCVCVCVCVSGWSDSSAPDNAAQPWLRGDQREGKEKKREREREREIREKFTHSLLISVERPGVDDKEEKMIRISRGSQKTPKKKIV